MRRAAPALAVALGAAALAGALGAAVAGSGPTPVDDAVAGAVAVLPLPWAAWRAVTEAGGAAILAPVGIVLVAALVVAGRLALALAVAVALLAIWPLTDGLKELLARPRPEGFPAELADGFAYPSGHALQSLAVYGLVALAAWRSALPAVVRGAVVVAALVLAGAVGASRVALGVHHPTDVVGGWLVGLTAVATVAAATARLDRDHHDPAADG